MVFRIGFVESFICLISLQETRYKLVFFQGFLCSPNNFQSTDGGMSKGEEMEIQLFLAAKMKNSRGTDLFCILRKQIGSLKTMCKGTLLIHNIIYIHIAYNCFFWSR